MRSTYKRSIYRLDQGRGEPAIGLFEGGVGEGARDAAFGEGVGTEAFPVDATASAEGVAAFPGEVGGALLSVLGKGGVEDETASAEGDAAFAGGSEPSTSTAEAIKRPEFFMLFL